MVGDCVSLSKFGVQVPTCAPPDCSSQVSGRSLLSHAVCVAQVESTYMCSIKYATTQLIRATCFVHCFVSRTGTPANALQRCSSGASTGAATSLSALVRQAEVLTSAHQCCYRGCKLPVLEAEAQTIVWERGEAKASHIVGIDAAGTAQAVVKFRNATTSRYVVQTVLMLLAQVLNPCWPCVAPRTVVYIICQHRDCILQSCRVWRGVAEGAVHPLGCSKLAG